MIRRDLLLDSSGGIAVVENKLCELSLRGVDPSVVVAELMLLVQGLSDELSFRDELSDNRLVFVRCPSILQPMAALRDGRVQLDVPIPLIEYMLEFFLRYYQAGYPEVDHLDLEVCVAHHEGVLDLIISV